MTATPKTPGAVVPIRKENKLSLRIWVGKEKSLREGKKVAERSPAIKAVPAGCRAEREGKGEGKKMLPGTEKTCHPAKTRQGNELVVGWGNWLR